MLIFQSDRMNNHEFTDFTIICEDQHFPVHRAVVGPKSEVLKKAMSGPWKVGVLSGRVITS